MTMGSRAVLRVACIQNRPGPDLARNLADAEAMVREAAVDGALLACLPEYFSFLDVGPDGRLVAPAFREQDHPALPRFSALAAELGIHLSLGSLPIAAGAGKSFNRSYLIGPDGEVLARYDKLHLFDVDLPGGESYRESDTIAPGSAAAAAPSPWGRIGLSVCYDLRFAHLYRRLAKAGAGILLVPAAFTATTGAAHWHVLVRARAIETGAFVVAACQTGRHPNGGASYGHSLIVDPWGQVLADAGEEVGVITADLDLAMVGEARRMIPAWSTDRQFAVGDGSLTPIRRRPRPGCRPPAPHRRRRRGCPAPRAPATSPAAPPDAPTPAPRRMPRARRRG
jgi:predicted amidohydrolase